MPLTKPLSAWELQGQTTREPHGPPSSENNPATVPDEASTGEMTSGPTLSGQPGKAVGHAVGNLTLRHDLAMSLISKVPKRPLPLIGGGPSV